MTSANNPVITRCPKCGTAFRVTPSQLQSAKGAVRCGSCLNVFKANEYLVASATAAATTTTTLASKAVAAKQETSPKPITDPLVATVIKAKEADKGPSLAQVATKSLDTKPLEAKPVEAKADVAVPSGKPVPSGSSTILSTIKPLAAAPASATTLSAAAPKAPVKPTPKPTIRTIDKSSLGQTDDILISDDMDDSKTEGKTYQFDGFMDIDMTPKSDVSLFERKLRDRDDNDEAENMADESWAEMLIEDEDEDLPTPRLVKAKTDDQLADDQLDQFASDFPTDDKFASHAVSAEQSALKQPAATKATAPGLVFSLVGERDGDTALDEKAPQRHNEADDAIAGLDKTASDDLVFSDELSRIPSHQGFNQPGKPERLDPDIFEAPMDDLDGDADADAPKRQVKTQPKMRSYDGSRTALLMNIIPAPIEFNAKRMRRWYQRKLWPTLSILALVALVVQVGWFKFDYFSRVEPYRTGYVFLCPFIGCQVPTLVDTSRIVASNLVVREHPEMQGALAVDVMLINSAAFEQPFPDLLLVFTDINEVQVASRRFTPKDYLGGELAGQELMPQNRKIHITLDLVDPGAEAVNYHISIPRS